MTYTMPRYPVHLIDIVVAANSRQVTIRPMLPQDLELQREFFRALSDNARYCRFMTPFNELPDALAQRFGQIDYRGHLALLAEVFEDRGETMVGETMVGEARYVVDEHDQSICEFALAIADEWQACGIGRALLQRLERQAARSGIRRMAADALFANKAMLGLAAHSGYALKTNRDDARLVRLEKQLSAAAASLTLHPLAA
jgi:acetyltransferase